MELIRNLSHLKRVSKGKIWPFCEKELLFYLVNRHRIGNVEKKRIGREGTDQVETQETICILLELGRASGASKDNA